MSDQYGDELRRGALVNALGLVGKLLFPLLIVALTWLFGPRVMGVYLLVFFIAEVAQALISSGFVDAVVVFGSRHADGDEAAMYRALGTSFRLPLALSVVLAAAFYLTTPALVGWVYEGRHELIAPLRLAGLSLPAIAVTNLTVAATKVRLRMEYDALLMSFARPVLLLGFSAVAYFLQAGVTGLMGAWLGTYVLLAVFGSWAMMRHFDLACLARAVFSSDSDPGVLRFAVPQSLNMTFNRYLTRLDVMMLGAFAFADVELALYASAALLTSHLREIKLLFSQVLAPIAARHHAAGQRAELEATLGKVARWTTTLAVPLVLVVAVLREDLLRILDFSYAAAPTGFMVVLLIPPLLSCSFGLAGNCIVFTGHSGVTLFNSVLVAALNTVFNLVLIPRYGLLGAALATALAAGLISVLQLLELGKLEGVWLRPRYVFKPQLGLALGCLALAALWDPATWSAAGRAGLAISLLVGFGLCMLLLRHEEFVGALGLRRRSAS